MYGRRTPEEFAESLHPDAELHPATAFPETGDYYGREEFLRGVHVWLKEWKTFRFIPEEVVDLGEQVLVRVRFSGRAKASSVELDQTIVHLWSFKAGMPWRLDVFVEERDALQAAQPPG